MPPFEISHRHGIAARWTPASPSGRTMVSACSTGSSRLAVLVLAALLFAPVTAAAAQVSLAWNASPDVTVTGYVVYYGTAPGLYSGSLDVGNQTAAVVTGLSTGVTYYFVVRAYNFAQVLSSPTNEVSGAAVATPQPGITSLSPTNGPVGTSVTITGTNFGATQGASTVRFNGTLAMITSWSATSIRATVPAGATTGGVRVTVGGATSNGVNFTVTVPPLVTSLSPTSGEVGTTVTLTGVNFGAVQGASTVRFNGALATVTNWSATSIRTTVPAGATSGTVIVTVGGVASNGVSFTVTASEIDLNGDGVDDILMQSSTSGVAVWLMDGAGHPGSFMSVYPDDIGVWKIVGTADLNRDGIKDILMQDLSSHAVAAWLMDGAGHISSFTYVYAGDIGDWKIVGKADLNRDGIVDILMQHASAHSVAAWIMDGAGHPASFMSVYPNDIGAWQVVGTADLNRDGLDDILMQHGSTHSVAAWIMDGTGHPASFTYVYPNDIGDWKVVGTADLNRDGIDDILMQHASAHSVAAWTMDGAGHIASFMYVYPGDIGDWRINGRD